MLELLGKAWRIEQLPSPLTVFPVRRRAPCPDMAMKAALPLSAHYQIGCRMLATLHGIGAIQIRGFCVLTSSAC